MKDLLIIALLLVILWLVMNRQSSGFASVGDTLRPGTFLEGDKALVSQNGKYKAVMQMDGNLVILNASNNKIWESGTFNTQQQGTALRPGTLVARVAPDGSFQIYAKNEEGGPGGSAWKIISPIKGNNLSFGLVMKDNGNLAVVRRTNNGENIVWNTQTAGK